MHLDLREFVDVVDFFLTRIAIFKDIGHDRSSSVVILDYLLRLFDAVLPS